MSAIPQKLDYLMETKLKIKDKIDQTFQDTNVPFDEYPNLIKNIPNTGAITPAQIDTFTRLAISINGENA